jgi:heme/copper-type cytochrome/quinol oxidase subunit 3
MATENTIEKFIAADSNRFAMALFLISEGSFFAFLIVAYVYFHGAMKSGPNATDSLHPLTTGIYTAFLLGSSFTMRRAEKCHSRDQVFKFTLWLSATIVCGAVFMVGQSREYLGLYRENITVSRNIFGTSFFTLTGFHGLHVLIGWIALLLLLAVSLSGSVKEPGGSAVRTIALYWHFVDWVWVIIFSVVYLWAFF